jgi:hypothetical protein
MQPSPETPSGANFPAIPLSKRAKRRWRRHQIVIHVNRPDYDRLRALRPRFDGKTPPKIARHLLLFALDHIEQQPFDPQQLAPAEGAQ